MNKKIKNIIMICLIILLLISVYFTLNSAKDSLTQDNFSQMQMGNPPDKPSDDNNQMTPPDMSSDNSSSDQNTPPDKPSDDNNKMIPPGMSSDNSLDTIYYVLFISEGILIGGLCSYLIVSNFNNKTLKETFENKNKIIVCLIGCIGATILITFSGVKLANKSENNNHNINGNSNQNISYKG